MFRREYCEDDAKQVGLLAIAINYLQDRITCSIGILLGSVSLGEVVYGKSSYDQRLSLLKRLVKYRAVPDLDKFLDRLRQIADTRNHLAHSQLCANVEIIGLSEDDWTEKVVSIERKKSSEFKRIDKKDREKIDANINEAEALAVTFVFVMSDLEDRMTQLGNGSSAPPSATEPEAAGEGDVKP